MAVSKKRKKGGKKSNKNSANKPPKLTLTASEIVAMNAEIQRQLATYDEEHKHEIDALILWVLHEQFGFGPKRLRKFYDSFSSEIDHLIERYEMDDSDQIWLCTYKLKEYGIDLEEWNKEEMRNA